MSSLLSSLLSSLCVLPPVLLMSSLQEGEAVKPGSTPGRKRDTSKARRKLMGLAI